MHRLRPRPRYEWQLRSRRLTLGERTLVMAILNVTPDSFSGDGLLTPGLEAAGARVAVAAAVAAHDAGADILDLGAESTRPNATPLTADEEQARLLPVLEGLRQARPDAIVSVDTYHAATATAVAKQGAEIVNDVSGLTWDGAMGVAVAQSDCGLILMHTRGRPREWLAQGPMSRDEVIPAIFGGLCEGVALGEAAGIATERIVVDPGFGFGKRGVENFALLAQLGRLNQLGRPLLIGLSRKSFLGEAVRSVQPEGLSTADARRSATIAAHTAAVLFGAHILRVHEVQAAREAAAVADLLLKTAE
ncbi:dihydropteroate synthase [Granulicella sp. 5B5]|uniref:dihydropteroate synthase n=1 Tax=Granulicella sp. 5B5 TaxID=1617967 RepID=UPI0015F3E723|nr:dihydropteroate synthase [Granulicella sp. 5B5]QMV18514.1 dihydropteroate synthase [Granulicella sp. 5B5]